MKFMELFTLPSMKSAPTPAFVNLETAARLAGVSRRWIQNKLASGEIPPQAVRIEKRRKLVAVSVLEAAFGPLRPLADASPSQGEAGGEVHGNFHEAAEVVELRAKAAAQVAIIATLQATLDHERADRALERDNWRRTLERTQANLLAAQDTPTARAIAGASKPEATDIPAKTVAATEKPKSRRAKKVARPWWRSLFAA